MLFPLGTLRHLIYVQGCVFDLFTMHYSCFRYKMLRISTLKWFNIKETFQYRNRVRMIAYGFGIVDFLLMGTLCPQIVNNVIYAVIGVTIIYMRNFCTYNLLFEKVKITKTVGLIDCILFKIPLENFSLQEDFCWTWILRSFQI